MLTALLIVSVVGTVAIITVAVRTVSALILIWIDDEKEDEQG